MPKKLNKVTGNLGEKIASQYLENKGYQILERNFRTQFGELDIVCYDGQILVFVEVKTKIGHDFGEPEEMVNKSKLPQVKKLGELYMQSNNIDCLCRVDVISVILYESGGLETIRHHEAVY